MNFKYYSLIIAFFLLCFSVNAEENKSKFDDNKNTEFNVYSGMFDFSDDGKRSALIGLQHQNENLHRNTFLGNLSPVTGALLTEDTAAYIYTGVQAQYKIGALNITPSFTPGLYNHLSNASIGDKNPGANSYMFNFLKNF